MENYCKKAIAAVFKRSVWWFLQAFYSSSAEYEEK